MLDFINSYLKCRDLIEKTEKSKENREMLLRFLEKELCEDIRRYELKKRYKAFMKWSKND